MNSIGKRVWVCIKDAVPKAIKLCIWLVKIILPISLAVRLLQYYGILDIIAEWLAPVFNFIGLPGETAVVFITSCFLPLYAPIAVMTSLALTVREATILALMCLISHNLPVECAVTHKTGSSFWGMIILRVAISFTIAIFLNLVMPADTTPFGLITQSESYTSLYSVLWAWFSTSISLTITIVLIVTALMILQNILQTFKLMDKLSRPLAPIMRFFGMSEKAPFLWIVGNVVGLTYGSAVMVDMVNEGKIDKTDANMVNHHLSISHSLLEDTLLFVALGVSFWWIIGTRLLFAYIVVWSARGINHLISRRKIPSAKLN